MTQLQQTYDKRRVKTYEGMRFTDDSHQVFIKVIDRRNMICKCLAPLYEVIENDMAIDKKYSKSFVDANFAPTSTSNCYPQH